MAELNHTIVWCSDKQRSAAFLTDILGLPPPRPFFHFLVVDLKSNRLPPAEENGVSYLRIPVRMKGDVHPSRQAESRKITPIH